MTGSPETAPLPILIFARCFHRNLSASARIKGKRFTSPKELPPMTLSVSEVNELKQAPAVEGVLPVILSRWSPRSFSDREVNTALLAKVFEAARWAPSSSNEQPWRFIVGVRDSSTHSKIASVLVSFNQVWAPHAPVLILGVAKTTFTHKGGPNAYALHDLGASAALLVLQAHALGLCAHQMAGFDHEAARRVLEIPEDYALGSVTALGYQGEPAALTNERLLAQEVAPRTRKPLTDLVFASWGTPAELG
jgi:nitroreductase